MACCAGSCALGVPPIVPSVVGAVVAIGANKLMREPVESKIMKRTGGSKKRKTKRTKRTKRTNHSRRSCITRKFYQNQNKNKNKNKNKRKIKKKDITYVV